MEKYKRYERLVALLKFFTDNPNKLVNLEQFMDMFNIAKSSASEDIDILEEILEKFDMGKLMTFPGAGGGVKYIPVSSLKSYVPFVKEVCERLKDPSRIIPGGFLYTADLIYSPPIVSKIAEVLVYPFIEKEIDAVVTVETKGIPIALMCARVLNVPLVIVRKDSRVTEGSFVSINYVSGSQRHIRSMSLARRALDKGAKVLLVDDFMKAGGTLKGMTELMEEFDAHVVGAGVMIATEEPREKLIDNYISIFVLKNVEEEKNIVEIEISDWILK
ncbi:purine operon repressor [Caldanaerobacter subterraneus subsp. tengcongensis MB4]|nr:pur operon repressor [Caldanaerobacter subterraneus]MBE3578726.1 pur operon repressor [Caldanaerobacter subterraneus]MCS3917423.1 purine operon repressor [Caldanaerobacter subterraneus subsp. tengcongensis MB4]